MSSDYKSSIYQCCNTIKDWTSQRSNPLFNLIIIVLLLILLILAIYHECNNYSLLFKTPDLSTSENTCEIYACHAKEEAIWKSIYISTFVSSMLILFFLYSYRIPINFTLILIIFASVFFPMYLMRNYKAFHYYGPLCDKAKK